MGKYVDIDHLGIVFLRGELKDMHRDFYQVARKAMEIWGGYPIEKGDLNEFKTLYEMCSPYKSVPPVHQNRIYVTTEYIYPALVMVDIKPNVISHMVSVTNGYGRDFDFQAKFMNFVDCITLWVFEGDILTQCIPVTPTTFGAMLTAFYPDNLVNREHHRLNWVGSLGPSAAKLVR